MDLIESGCQVKSRVETLTELLELSRPLDALQRSLSVFPWDVHEELVEMTIAHAHRIASRYLRGELSADDLEKWGNVMEGREDIYFSPRNEQLLKEFLHEIANPGLTGELTHSSIKAWVERFTTCD
jgi:hypothetical protein